MSQLKKVLITGAGGRVGSALRRYLKGRYALRLFDVQPLADLTNDEELVVGDVADAQALQQATQGMDALVHLAIAVPQGDCPPEAYDQMVLHTDIGGTYNAFAAARQAGLETVVFASSNAATGGYETRGIYTSPDMPVRPDNFYGVGKVFGEAIGRLYHDHYGLSVYCIRIANFPNTDAVDQPYEAGLSRWLSARDMAELTACCLEAPKPQFGIFYGVSQGGEEKWSIANVRELVGWEPQDHGIAPDQRRDVPEAVTKALGLSTRELAPFFASRNRAQALRNLDQLAAWMAQVNTQNHDGVTLTPPLVQFLADGDMAQNINALDQRRRATAEGRFDPGDRLQRELEYRRYAAEAARQPSWPQDDAERRTAFEALDILPPQEKAAFRLSDRDQLEAQRAAWEARSLLHFLRHFRAHTQRPIVVLGNERYGRLFVVEPLEPHLANDFAVHYERAPSHKSMRLTVPHYTERFQRNGFAPELMRQLSDQMPHVVLVDVCSPRGTEHYTKVPRGIRDLVNWFMVFNHLRAGGDRSQYEEQSGLPPHLLDELEAWYEFTLVRRRIEPWIAPGSTYTISHWAPELKEEVLMGDLAVPRRPAVPGDEPQVILANPALYRSEGDDLPELLRRTEAYYFNDPEKRVREEIVPGFGRHGFATRVLGCTTEQYVEAVQQAISRALT